MPKTPLFPITVFFDGSCSVCAAEIEHYKHRDHDGRLLLVDISAPDFRPELYNIDLKEFMHELHVFDQAGNVYLGIDAFRAIWLAFPASTLYGLLAALIRQPVIYQLAQLGYKGFALIRRYLPKNNSGCGTGVCGIRKD